jgi:hypothetical protein
MQLPQTQNDRQNKISAKQYLRRAIGTTNDIILINVITVNCDNICGKIYSTIYMAIKTSCAENAIAGFANTIININNMADPTLIVWQ